MTTSTLRSERLRSHRLSAPARSVEDAATHMLAVQSQDFTAGRWALAIRTRGAPTLSALDEAFARGELVRAWTMRGTLHIVPARDLRWMLGVTAERQRRQAAARHRGLGIDDEMVEAAFRVLRPSLSDGGCTRAEAFELLDGIGIDPRGQRGIHLLYALTLDGRICQGPVEPRPSGISRDQRFVLIEEHIQESASPDDPLSELFVRYVAGHGPASVPDFAWWSGLPLGLAREAATRSVDRVEEAAEGLFVSRVRQRRSGQAPVVHALGAFDEYYLSYADRTVVCAPENLDAVGPGKNGMVRPTVLVDGAVAGVWGYSAPGGARSVTPTAELFSPGPDKDAVAAALDRYAAFLTG